MGFQQPVIVFARDSKECNCKAGGKSGHRPAVREAKGISQGEIDERSGLLRCYISRVENGHTVPSIETLEKLAPALGTPIYAILSKSHRGLKRPRSG